MDKWKKAVDRVGITQKGVWHIKLWIMWIRLFIGKNEVSYPQSYPPNTCTYPQYPQKKVCRKIKDLRRVFCIIPKVMHKLSTIWG